MRRAVFLGGAVLAAACRPAPAPAQFLNFDSASGAAALRTGWSSFEHTPEGDTYVWSAGPQARLVVPAPDGRDLLIRFRCWPFWFEGAPEQVIGLAVNGTGVGTVPLLPDRHVYSVYVPRTAWRPGANEVTLTFAYTARPQDHVGGTDDRTLAVAFDWLEIVPPPRPQ